MRFKVARCLLGVWMMLGGAAASAADIDPEDAIKYRQAYMKALGGHSGAFSLIARGKVSLDGRAKMHAQAMAQLSKDLLTVFPKGSDFGETRAKAEIWQRWDAFSKLAQDSANASAALLKAVDAGDKSGIAELAAKLGETCKACHKDFRAEEK